MINLLKLNNYNNIPNNNNILKLKANSEQNDYVFTKNINNQDDFGIEFVLQHNMVNSVIDFKTVTETESVIYGLL